MMVSRNDEVPLPKSLSPDTLDSMTPHLCEEAIAETPLAKTTFTEVLPRSSRLSVAMQSACRLILLLCLLTSFAASQVVAPPQPVPPEKQAAPKSEQKSEQKEEQSRISKAQADELFRSVDSILQWVSKETNLPVKRKVKRELASRSEVQKYVEDRMKTDEDAQRLKRSELVLKKFGLLPRDFDLGTFMVQLLREQVVGFYDPKKQTVFLLNWVDAEQQRPVLAHELTHALQDQNFDLEKWLRAGVSEPKEAKGGNGNDRKAAEKEQRELQKEIDADEIESARQAVTEGQGMAVLIDFMLEPMGRSLTNSSDLVEAMKQNMQSGADSPVFQHAPVFLKEAMTFPYRYGLGFVQALLQKGGSKLAYAGALERPPSTARQIMIPAMSSILGPAYQKFDVGAMGEFDVYLLLDQYSGQRTAARLTPHWRGGYYYAAQKKDSKDTAGKPGGAAETASPSVTKSVSLFYVSRWDTERAANDFAAMYAAGLPARYGFVKAPADEERAGKGTVWTTDEGPVVIQASGNVVVITESFTEAEAAKLRDAALQAEHTAAKSSQQNN